MFAIIKLLIFIMYKFLLSVLLITFVLGCTAEVIEPPTEDSTATGSMICQINLASWSASDVQVNKLRDTLLVKGKKILTGDSNYSYSEINFKIINASQPGTFGIGEDESGFKYFVKGDYRLKSSKGLPDVVYTAYYRDFSLMTVTDITNKSIQAEFKMKVFDAAFSDSLLITSGRININY